MGGMVVSNTAAFDARTGGLSGLDFPEMEACHGSRRRLAGVGTIANRRRIVSERYVHRPSVG